ncbi:PH domain-containing protein [Paenimyroides aestuarii]|uniref:PH domain-containing protein n=1 Tax=Paenimyroides aestuarii TaxID=2968490 RepID=A0ABY5NQL9_9FLAO|nr:PH domain-containing protein [Paenimyroides aestuarii]UUV20816.1 PH domain-containing protein [Paenimyroides aestuarii]
MFQNNTISINEIPTYQEVETQPLHHNYRKIVWLNSLIILFLGAAGATALFFIFEEVEKWYFISGILFICLLLAIFPLISYKKKRYAFRQHDVIFKKGLIFKNTHISPYIRLQHVVIKQGWYAKKLGLATLALYTAANNFSDISIPGLTLEEAERWKSFLMNRMEDLNNESENEL